MIKVELMSADDFFDLPDDPLEKFAKVEEICRRKFNQIVGRESTEELDRLLYLQYMNIVAAAAEEAGIKGFTYPYNMDNPLQEFDNFMLRANGVTTRFRLRSTKNKPEDSVKLTNTTRARIEQQIQKLRDIIIDSEFDEEKKKKLLDKLEELSRELSRSRLNISKVMVIIALVGASLTGTTGFLADVPDALATIVSLIGADKEAEDAEMKRLGPVTQPKALPSPPKLLMSPEKFGNSNEASDDEIPF